MPKPIYVLGTGLSHNGSAVLLKDGRVCVAIEKERISRKKHDGGNDTLAIQYCLDAEGISLDDISLVVQCENFTLPERHRFQGERLFANSTTPKIIDISHHLAHAYSAIGTSPFTECVVMVIDGCGSPLTQYMQLHPEEISKIDSIFLSETQMLCEKDSYYFFDGKNLTTLYKDFSEMSNLTPNSLRLPTTKHSIGGFYATMSKYVFGDMDDVGKLMGLAPYGESGVFLDEAFVYKSGRLFVTDSWQKTFDTPSLGYDYFKAKFQYYANVAKWAQEQVEKALLTCFWHRSQLFHHKNLCYSGGVALNAVANAKLQDKGWFEQLYFEPAAADNGLALGCAFYGWMHYLKMPKVVQDGSTCFGKKYSTAEIETTLQTLDITKYHICFLEQEKELLKHCAHLLNQGKTMAWFQDGSEFGPRALGRRSILAHPGIPNMKEHINGNIKFREDFRPFAPSVLQDFVEVYFEHGRKSPYMILVDKTRPAYTEILKNVTHQDGSARVQTVDKSWNSRYYNLILEFYNISGIAVVLNTSLNRKGMPMAETPKEAIALFAETALDVLVLENYVLTKR